MGAPLALGRQQLFEQRLATRQQAVAIGERGGLALAPAGRRPKTTDATTSSSASVPAAMRPVLSVDGRPVTRNDSFCPGLTASIGITQYLRPLTSRDWRAPIPGPSTARLPTCSMISVVVPRPFGIGCLNS